MNLKFWKKEAKPTEGKSLVQYQDGIYFLGSGQISAPKLSNALQASMLSDAVYGCISVITQAALDVPWFLYKRQGKNIVKDVEHPSLSPFLQNPGENMSWPELIEGYLNYILLAGNCYIRPFVGSFGTAGIIELARPDRVTVDRDFFGEPKYTFTTETGQLIPIDKEEMIHLKLFNPKDNLIGLSPITSIAAQIDIGSFAQAWILALLEKGAMPAVALSTDKTLTPEQRTVIKKQLQEKTLGYKNVMNPLILEGGLKPQKISFTPKELNFMPLTKGILRKICSVFNVAPELLGDAENKTYSNVKEAEKGLYEKACSPHLRRLRDKLNTRVVPLFDKEDSGYYFDFDLSSVDALSENKEMLWKRVNEAVDKGLLSRDEGRQVLQFGKAKDKGADKLTVAASTVPLEAVVGDIGDDDDTD